MPLLARAGAALDAAEGGARGTALYVAAAEGELPAARARAPLRRAARRARERRARRAAPRRRARATSRWSSCCSSTARTRTRPTRARAADGRSALALAEVPFAKQDGARRSAPREAILTLLHRSGAHPTLAPTPALQRLARAAARRGARGGRRARAAGPGPLVRSLELVVAEAAAHRDDDEPPVWRGLYDVTGGHADVGWA